MRASLLLLPPFAPLVLGPHCHGCVEMKVRPLSPPSTAFVDAQIGHANADDTGRSPLSPLVHAQTGGSEGLFSPSLHPSYTSPSYVQTGRANAGRHEDKPPFIPASSTRKRRARRCHPRSDTDGVHVTGLAATRLPFKPRKSCRLATPCKHALQARHATPHRHALLPWDTAPPRYAGPRPPHRTSPLLSRHATSVCKS